MKGKLIRSNPVLGHWRRNFDVRLHFSYSFSFLFIYVVPPPCVVGLRDHGLISLNHHLNNTT
jgi:hypothetical protein